MMFKATHETLFFLLGVPELVPLVVFAFLGVPVVFHSPGKTYLFFLPGSDFSSQVLMDEVPPHHFETTIVRWY